MFYQTILNTIAFKNKSGFPFTYGLLLSNHLAFQDLKIKLLLKAAILERKTSPIRNNILEYPLGSIDLLQITFKGLQK